jgi:hypothetical protein
MPQGYIKEAMYQFYALMENIKLLGSPECHPRSLRGCWRFLRGVLLFFDIMDAPRINQGSYVSIFKSPPS